MSLLKRVNIEFTGQKRSALDMARGRLVLLSLFFIIAYIIVAFRITELTIIRGELKRDEKTVSYLEAEPVRERKIHRADIVDRNGVILARSLKTSSLYADPAMISDPKAVAKEIVEIFPDLSYGDTLQKLQDKRRFVWIKRNITPDDQYKILYLGHPGLSFRDEQKRIYPQGNLAAHMVGYTSVDDRGLAGLEAGFDKLLMDAEEPLVTTLDVRIQHALRREVHSAMKEFNAIAGTGIVMDVHSGEVLGAVSLPDFDPNNVDTNNKDALFNRVTLGVYEPGSTFKIFTAAAVIEMDGAKMGRTYDARKAYEAGRFRINDYFGQKRILTLPEVFMYSSNVGSVYMAEQVGTEKYTNFLKDLGLLDPSPIEIPEVAAPLVPRPWREISTVTASFGHGIAVTPMQIISAASSIMNGGVLVKPVLVADHADKKKSRAGKNGVRVVSEQTAHRMRQLARLTVTKGTSAKAEVPGYNVGGKTGTADKNEGRGYTKEKRRASMMAFFPIEAPKYAVYVMIDEPKGTKETRGNATGGWVAAPLVGRVVESLVAIEGIKPQDGDELAGTLDAYVKTKEQIEKERKLASIKTP